MGFRYHLHYTTALVLTSLLSSCFSPSRNEVLNCSADGLCPDGLTCNANNVCGEPLDASEDSLAPELTGLVLSLSSPLDPAFDPARLSYQTDVSVLESEVIVTPTALDTSALIVLDGLELSSGVPSAPISLDLGINRLTVVVTAVSGETRNYEIEIVRGANVVAQIAYGKASNSDANDRFGSQVVLDDDTLVVGVERESSDATGIGGNQDNNRASSSGAVYVFRRTDGVWSQEAYIKASNAEGQDRFGHSVALHRDTLVVGAVSESGSGLGNSEIFSGAVYVYHRTAGAWAEEAYLKASNVDSFDQFGVSVAVFGDYLAVGADRERSVAVGLDGNQTNNDLPSSGAVYLFHRTENVWEQSSYVKASNSGMGDQFGISVSLSDTTLVVGAPNEDSGATGSNGNQSDNTVGASGAVYVFRRTDSTWLQEAYLKASNPDSTDQFGDKVSVSGDTIAIGAPNESSNATGTNGNQSDNTELRSGAVYIFKKGDQGWEQEAYLKASNTQKNDDFGGRISIHGDLLAVGAKNEDSAATGVGGDSFNNDAADSGSVYLFRRSAGGWIQEAYIKSVNSERQDEFGSLSLSSTGLAIGAIGESSSSTGFGGDAMNNEFTLSGAVYVFQ